MRDEPSVTRAAAAGEQQIMTCRRLAVGVAGGFIGENELRPPAGRARHHCCSPPEAARGMILAIGATSAVVPRARRIGLPANSSGSATFSSAVMVGTRWKDWKTMPMCAPRASASWSSLSEESSCPATRTLPLVARSSRQ
jgi:hypothetical protein